MVRRCWKSWLSWSRIRGLWSSSTIAASCAGRDWATSQSRPVMRSSSCILSVEGDAMPTAVETVLDTPLTIGGRTFQSRLLVGTGKYPDMDTMTRAIEASGAEVVTVAVRRGNLDRSKETSVLHFLDPRHFFLLANTAGCYTAADAIRYARLAREAGFNDFVKLEVIGDEETRMPDVQGLLEAAKVLVQEGFKVLAYTNEDLVTALRLEDAGCAAVMPLASPIGSGLGLLNPLSVRTIKRRLHVPVIVDAGVGTASDACVTMEQGVDGILMNTASATAGSRMSCRPVCCVVSASSTPPSTSDAPIPVSTTFCASARTSCGG